MSSQVTIGPRAIGAIAGLGPGTVISGYYVFGALGAASIGLPLVLAGLLALASAGPRQASIPAGTAAGAVSTLVFVAGVALTWPNSSP